jgi:AraC-like DNA-binding protein
MTKRNRPAVDDVIAPAHGVSRGGQPLSYNRAPAPDLSPWIGRLYATKIDMPADYRLDGGIFNDTAMVHVQLGGVWRVDPSRTFSDVTLITGPHTRLMPVSVTGSFISVGYTLRPGATMALVGLPMPQLVDRVVQPAEIGSPSMWKTEHFDVEAHPESWLEVLENGLRDWLALAERRQPDTITARFENLAFVDPSISIAAFARDCGVGERTVERIVRRDFGMPPKQVLCRARALDMASHLRGVADAAEAEQLALRYYDQSHLIHEFTDLFGMSPRQFAADPQPLLTLALGSRQSRRLEAIERIAPGGIKPWE